LPLSLFKTTEGAAELLSWHSKIEKTINNNSMMRFIGLSFQAVYSTICRI
jgi:hypothetical protein